MFEIYGRILLLGRESNNCINIFLFLYILIVQFRARQTRSRSKLFLIKLSQQNVTTEPDILFSNSVGSERFASGISDKSIICL